MAETFTCVQWFACRILYDIKKGAYQNIIMYCVMMLFDDLRGCDHVRWSIYIGIGCILSVGRLLFHLFCQQFYASFVCNERGKTMGWTGACCQQSVCGGNGFDVTDTVTFAKLCHHCNCTCVICHYKWF